MEDSRSVDKYVFREAMRQRIPESVRTRADKMGFATPVGIWVATGLYEPIADLLGSQVVREGGLYHTHAIIRELHKHRNGKLTKAATNSSMWCNLRCGTKC